MDVLNVCHDVIQNVLLKNDDFATSLKIYCVDKERDYKNVVSSLCGIYFRNFFLINEFLKEWKISKESDEGIAIGLCFANNSFRHYENDSKVLENLFSLLETKKFNLTGDFKNCLTDLIVLRRKYKFKKPIHGLIDNVSIKFNLPSWVLKVLTKQFGKEQGLEIAHSLSSMPKQYASLQFKKKIEDQNALKNFDLIDGDIYLFKGASSIKKEEIIYNNLLYPTQLQTIQVFSKVPCEKHSNYSMIIDKKDTIVYDFIKHFYDKSNKLNILSSNLKSNFQVFDKVRGMRRKNIFSQEAQSGELCAIFNEKQKVILYSPKSSDIESFRRKPEYGCFFDSGNLDNYINSMKKGIVEISEFIDNNGYLIYYVPTINGKETVKIKEYFLENKGEEFELIDEKQFLPNEKENSLLYCAIFRRK